MFIKFVIVVLLSSFQLFAYAKEIKIVTTTGMIEDMVKNIVGDHAEVVSLMPSGTDPHLYKATQGDLRKIIKADMIFYNGLHLEGKMQPILKKMARQKPVKAISDDLNQVDLIHYENQQDPHIWFDVTLWQQAVKTTLETLITHYPQHKNAFELSAKAYLEKLVMLNEWTAAQIKQIPVSQRVLITAHDAFGYFGKAYGMKVTGLQGISTATEFGLRDIAELKQLIVTNNIKAVFVESSVPKKYISSLVKGVKADSNDRHSITIGGELYSDAMGPKGSGADTYISMVRHNVNTIVAALK